ncbi:MAG TPA: BlaI/MecI/CopY family transcriptional regulator [Thermoanaerobaculia bacterium]|nr:BlaI/MecI/CopY family transcriptional regulator [Thermoanaerobaculia bacterium]
MAREQIDLTKFETEVMSVLWRLGEATVREVQDGIDRDDLPAYTTVQTIIQRLEQKGAVRRTRKEGNALFFEPAITRKSVYRRLVDELLDLVGGSQPLVAHLVESGKLSLDDLRAIEKAAKKSRK